MTGIKGRRGGARTGAGRKVGRKVFLVNYRFSPEIIAAVKDQAKIEGISHSKLVEKYLKKCLPPRAEQFE
jgi:hypothetical protein